MICPRCLENNPDSYRFCGMCGDDLQVADTSAGPPKPKIPNASTRAQAPRRPSPAPAVAPETIQPLSGPSLLGLDQPSDSVPDKTLAGFDSYVELDHSDSGWKKVLLLLVIVGALVAAGWWGYKIGWWGGSPKSPAANASPAPAIPPQESATKPNTEEARNSPPAAMASPANAPESRPETSSAIPDTKPGSPAPGAAETAKTTGPTPPAETGRPQPNVVVTPPVAKPAVAKPAAPAVPAADSPDALFRQGEAYLYGRGVAESCPQAMKYLKSASDKGNAKARGTLGTMYSTGHCVARDLPSSYHWFALALRADPNNQILEKDLSAVWNQMTPPERQVAMKSQ